MGKEEVKITVVTNTDNICPVCGLYVDKGKSDTAYLISGHGKFKRKQYYHKDCLERAISGQRSN